MMYHNFYYWLACGLLLCSLTLIVTATMLPNTALAWLRSEYRWLGQPLNWIENRSQIIGWIHLLLFALLGAVARLVLSRWRIALLLASLVALAALSELVQFWIPGRTPRISDFTADVVGAVVGVAVVWGGQWLWRLREYLTLLELRR